MEACRADMFQDVYHWSPSLGRRVFLSCCPLLEGSGLAQFYTEADGGVVERRRSRCKCASCLICSNLPLDTGLSFISFWTLVRLV